MKKPKKGAITELSEVEAEGNRALTDDEKSAIKKELKFQETKNKALLEEVVFILQSRLSASGIKIHDIEQRIKGVESILKKCETKGIQDHKLLVDIVGARVVCLFRSDMQRVNDVIRKNFDVVSVDDKLADVGPLGYQSTHYVCKMPDRYIGPRYEGTTEVNFEIQVRTLCMHAWAAVSHHLDYKGDWDVPEDLKQALSALGGLFYVADNEFEQFYSARQKSKKEAENVTGSDDFRKLNLDTIISYLRQKLPDRKQPSSSEASSLVRDLKAFGCETIEELDRTLVRGEDAFREYERKFPPVSGRFVAVGVVRVTDRIVHNRSSAIRYQIDQIAHLVKPE